VEPRQLGKLVVVAGAVAIVVGLLLWGGLLSWFGHLPGDLRFEGERTRVHVPLTSMLLVSVVLSLVLQVVRRL
jgi:hypothetical protein